MDTKVTKCSPPYPQGYEPDYVDPQQYCAYRFGLGKLGNDPLVAICMNPSAAREESSDKTINRIIAISKMLEKDGWVVFNLYPERATKAWDIKEFNQALSKNNIKHIREFLINNEITEVLGAWGNDNNISALKAGKQDLLSMLKEINVKVFYYGTLTKAKNPRHPLQRYEKVNYIDGKKWLDF